MKSDVLLVFGAPALGMRVPHFTLDASGIERVKRAYGEGGELTRMVIERIHDEAAAEFGRLLGPILEDWFS
jgi:hypothetical protein